MEQKKLWFKAKQYGYGWYPVSWQGWGILLMYIFAVTRDFFFINTYSHSVSDTLIGWFPHFFILSVFLHIICTAYGEPARWRWGR